MFANAKTVVLAACLVSASAAAHAQTLPHGIPQLCAADPARVVIAVGATGALTGDMSCVEVRGRAVVTGALTVRTILAYPGSELEFAEGSTTTFLNATIDLTTDPEQWGHGLVAIDAKVRALGQLKKPFIRLAADVLAGATTLLLGDDALSPAPWLPGDVLFLPDTRHLTDQNWFNAAFQPLHERIAIASVSTDGRTVTLVSPTLYAHRGALSADGSRFAWPHVANLTRSIVIRSQDPNGTRGHMAFIGRTDVDLRGVEIVDMGRTKVTALQSAVVANGVWTPGANQIGRYPLHIHMLAGPVNPTNTGYQFTVIGNVIRDSLKWPIAVHASHYGRVEDNVVIGGAQFTGAGLAFEDGSETENLVKHNFIGDIRGRLNPRNTGPSHIGANLNGTTPGSGADCLWAAGFSNRFVDNVFTGCRNSQQEVASGAGMKFSAVNTANTAKVPLFRGADCLQTSLVQCASINPRNQPILEHRGNECYGLMSTCLTIWYLHTDGYSTPFNAPRSVVKDLTVWHTYNGTAWLYPTVNLTLDGLRHLGAVVADGSSPGVPAITAGDYRTIGFELKNSFVQAGSVIAGTTDPLGTFVFENNVVVSRQHAYRFRTPDTPGTGASRPPALGGITMIIRGGSVTAWPGYALKTIAMEHVDRVPNPGEVDREDQAGVYRVKVENYQSTGAAFDVYFAIQATQALYGGLAPSGADSTTRPEIAGLTFGSTTPTPVPCAGAWGPWTEVSRTATMITEQRTFTVTTPPANGGTACPPSPETRLVPIVVDCLGDWSPWVEVSRTATEITEQRTFTVTTPAANGGTPCPASPETRLVPIPPPVLPALTVTIETRTPCRFTLSTTKPTQATGTGWGVQFFLDNVAVGGRSTSTFSRVSPWVASGAHVAMYRWTKTGQASLELTQSVSCAGG